MLKQKTTTKKSIKKVTKQVTKKTPAKKVTRKAPAKKAVKKTVKKTTTKKPVTKKKTLRKTAKKAPAMKRPVTELVYASDDTSFWTTDGQILNSLTALRDALLQMEKDVFDYHAGGEQNDFSMWVDGVLCDGDCAAALEKARTSKGAHTIVTRHLKRYTV